VLTICSKYFSDSWHFSISNDKKFMIIANTQKKTRIVTAPHQSLLSNFSTVNIPSTVISVELKENEEVEWIWTSYPNGQRVITGYNIIQK
jgi:hypothetical protein